MIVCKSCRAEAHPLREGYYATGCDCVPLELVQKPTRNDLSRPVAEAWDLLVQATNARDIAVSNATERVEHEWRGIIEMRRAAFMAAIDREKVATPTAAPQAQQTQGR
jgi:hypothetical protein